MITEDYVSFETAKLLKEKGFNEGCRQYLYRGNLIFSRSEIWNRELDNYEDEGWAAPTLQMAMKWLRENYNIYCDIGYDDCDWFWNIISVDKNVPVEDRPLFIKNGLAGYKSYEEACEEAIKYCLKELI